MPRYYFHIDGSGPDEVGVQYETLAKAKCAAVETAGQAICDDAELFWDKKDWGMTVTNGAGLSLFSLSFFAMEAPAVSDRKVG
jgi:hypothetical protein